MKAAVSLGLENTGAANSFAVAFALGGLFVHVVGQKHLAAAVFDDGKDNACNKEQADDYGDDIHVVTSFGADNKMGARDQICKFGSENPAKHPISASYSASDISIPASTRAKWVGIPAYVELRVKSDVLGALKKESFPCQTTQTQTSTVAKGSPVAGYLSQLPCLSRSSLRSPTWAHRPCQKTAFLMAHRPLGLALTALSRQHNPCWIPQSRPLTQRQHPRQLSSNKPLHLTPTALGGRPSASAFCASSHLIGAATC